MHFDQMQTSQKIVPYNIESEEAVLGSMLLDPDAILKVTDVLTAGDFFRESHQWTFDAIMALWTRHSAIDTLTVSKELERRGLLAKIGGEAFVSGLLMRVPTAIHAEYYAQMVKDASGLRQSLSMAEQIAKAAYSGMRFDEVIELAQSLIVKIAQGGTTRKLARPLMDIMSDVIDTAYSIYENKVQPGIPSASEDLNRLLGGYQRGDLIILAARPSMGKSARAVWDSIHAALNGYKVAFFSLEMGDVNVGQRIAAAYGGLDSQTIRVGPIRDSQILDELSETADLMRDWNLTIDETGSLSFSDIRSRTMRYAYDMGGLDLIIVDYLTIMKKVGDRNDSNSDKVGLITNGLKTLAKEMKVAVVCLAQLNRECDARMDKRPMLSDLRESGNVEQDADVVIFLYRDEVYNSNCERPGIAEMIIAKHRNGPVGVIEQYYDKPTGKWGDLTEEDKRRGRKRTKPETVKAVSVAPTSYNGNGRNAPPMPPAYSVDDMDF